MPGRHLRAATAGLVLVLASSCQQVMGPTPPDTNWAVHARSRFTFYVRPASFAEQSVETLNTVLDDQFSATVTALDLRYAGHISVFLHESGRDAGFAGDAGSGDHSGVAYPATETVKAAAVPPLDGNLMSLVSHEINHVIIENGLGRPGTTFLNEGMASAMLSERHHALGPTSFHRWVATHISQVPPLASLVDDDRWREHQAFVAYTTAASFLAYLLETYGPSPLRALYPVASSRFSNRFRELYGVSLEEAERTWLAYCRERGGQS